MPELNEDAAGHPQRRAARSILDLVENRRKSIAGIAITSLSGGLAEAAFLILLTRAAFAISGGKGGVDLWGGRSISVGDSVLIGLALVVFRMAFSVLGNAQTSRLMSGVVADIRQRLAREFLSASWATQQSDRVGQLQELLTTFTGQSSVLINNFTLEIVAGFSLLAILVLAIVVNPGGAAVVVVGVVIFGSLLRPVRAAVQRRGTKSASAGMAFATSLGEVSQLGLEMHVFHVQEATRSRVGELIDRTAEADRQLVFARALVPSLYTSFAYLALLGALAALSLSKSASLVSLGAVMLLMLRALSYGQALQSSSASIASTLPYLDALDAKLKAYEAGRQHDGGEPVGSVGTLRFDCVGFAYEPGQPVLKNMTFEIRPGEVVGIVGPSGGGKSTLVQLLLGLREPAEGTVTADNRPLRDLSRAEWARKVTFVPQGVRLITGSIADNIRFLRDDVTQDDVERAARQASLYEEVMRFPDGFERKVDMSGGQLSGGQQQRLCIARALVERPDVLILDEPTSALDVRSEQLIRATLLELHDQMTIIIIAHRLSTLDICERIMVVQDGEIRGFDTPANLTESNDFYHEALVLSGLL